MRGLADDRGSVAAELALALPAVVLTVMLGVGALGAASRQVSLQDASADAARLLGRGEDAAAASLAVTTAVPGATVSSAARGDLICVTASAEVAIGGLIRVPLRASSCALAGGL
nr:TadE family type IV pilus minor pilin [uncultured Microbacterium sp.]